MMDVVTPQGKRTTLAISCPTGTTPKCRTPKFMQWLKTETEREYYKMFHIGVDIHKLVPSDEAGGVTEDSNYVVLKNNQRMRAVI